MAVRRPTPLVCLLAVYAIASVVSGENRVVRQINENSIYSDSVQKSARDGPSGKPRKDAAVSATGGDAGSVILPDPGHHLPDDLYKPMYRQDQRRNKPTKCVEYDHDVCKNENRKCGDTTWCGVGGLEPFCYTLWHNKSGEILLKQKGCWLPSTDGECIQQQCLHTKAKPNMDNHADGPIFFCCCNETLCNTEYRYEVDENAVLTHHESLLNIKAPVSGGGSVATVSLLWPIMVFCAAVVIVALLVGAIIYYAAVRRRVKGKSSSLWPSRGVNQRRQADNNMTAPGFGRHAGAAEMQQRNPLLEQPDLHDDDAETLDSLELCERIAKSRYSEVWLGKFNDKTTGSMQRCAVKVVLLSDKAIGDNETQIYRYVRQFEHANILRFLGKRTTEIPNAEFRSKIKPQLQIVTEYHAHGSLLSYLKSNVLEIDAALNIITNMVEGLSFLHFERRGGKPIIAHRDFKSSNVLLKDNMDACISDFGLAAVFFDGEEIRSYEQVGTDRYMAPELLDGAINKTREAFLHIDMYACGLVTWEVLSRTKMHAEEQIASYKMPLEAELAEYDNNNSNVNTNGAVVNGAVMPTQREGGGGDEKQKLIRKLTQAVVHDKKRPVKRPEWDKHDMVAEAWRTAEQSLDPDPEGRPSAALWLSRLRRDGMHDASMRSAATMQRVQNSACVPFTSPISPVNAAVNVNSFYAGYPSSPVVAADSNTNTTYLIASASNGFINQLLPQNYAALHNNIMPLPYYQGYAFNNHQRPNFPSPEVSRVASAITDANQTNQQHPSSPASTIRTLPDLVCTPPTMKANVPAAAAPAVNNTAAANHRNNQSHHYYNDIVSIEHVQSRQQPIPVETMGESPPPPLPPRAHAKTAYG